MRFEDDGQAQRELPWGYLSERFGEEVGGPEREGRFDQQR